MHTAILTAAVALAASLLAAPALAAEPGDVALTAEQMEDFTAAAEAAGIDADAIEEARSDPELAMALPVYEEQSEPVEALERAMPKQPGLEHHQGGIRGRSRSVTVTYRNFWGLRLLSFKMTKYWEYSGRRVTYAPAPRVSGNVTASGSVLGWVYSGVIGSSDYYRTWNGRWRGAHLSWRQGKFKHCLAKVGCVWSRYPQVSIEGRGDGSYSRGGRR